MNIRIDEKNCLFIARDPVIYAEQMIGHNAGFAAKAKDGTISGQRFNTKWEAVKHGRKAFGNEFDGIKLFYTPVYKPTFEDVLSRFIRRDYDGVSTTEAEVLRCLFGSKEASFRSLRDLYVFTSGLEDNEYIKFVRHTLKQIKVIRKQNIEAGKQALDWFNKYVVPAAREKVSWWK